MGALSWIVWFIGTRFARVGERMILASHSIQGTRKFGPWVKDFDTRETVIKELYNGR